MYSQMIPIHTDKGLSTMVKFLLGMLFTVDMVFHCMIVNADLVSTKNDALLSLILASR